MGTKCYWNEKNESHCYNGNFMIRDEEKVNEGKNLTINQLDLLNKKSKKSNFEITKDKGYGSGFFCKIKLPNNNNEEI